MKLVVDSNILFTYFWKESVTKELLLKEEFELFAPEFALEEINKYKEEIQEKTSILEEEFKTAKTDIAIAVNFISTEEYKAFLKEALKIAPDPNDIDFFALALKLKISIWSNDKKLKEQKLVRVYTTEEIVNLLIL